MCKNPREIRWQCGVRRPSNYWCTCFRREHKERSQPSHRRKYGLLEKHKDYVERARDYHKKQDYLQTLRKKAAFRNPDEFYTAMHKYVNRWLLEWNVFMLFVDILPVSFAFGVVAAQICRG